MNTDRRGSKIADAQHSVAKRGYEGLIPSTEWQALNAQEADFVRQAIKALYKRILWSVINTVDAGSDKNKSNLNRTCADNYTVRGEDRYGLIHYIAEAMVNKRIIILEKEKASIIEGLEFFNFTAESKGATWEEDEDNKTRLILDFTKYELTDTLTMYYSLLFSALEGAGKGIKITQALILKINELTKLMSTERNVEQLEAQLKQLDESVRAGRLAYVDAGSSVDFPVFSIEPSEKAIEFIYGAIANVIGYPISFITGKDTGSSLGDTGEAERKRIRRANQHFFLELVLPILERVYLRTFELYVEIENAENMAEMFALMRDDTYLTHAAKTRTLANMFGFKADDFLPEEEVEDPNDVIKRELAALQGEQDENEATTINNETANNA